ncbi:hypothetical protein B0H14DRAFT_2603838 [Mycena olivaceomarginata]|nr:hypothetical protein B0H14DRAFT_2603838 [Mycena olivaceomarginata]
MYHWLEQYEWKHAELLRVIRRYRHNGKVWAGLAEREEGLNGVNGMSTYAHMEAEMCWQLVHNAEVIFKSADLGAYHDWVSATSFDEMMGKIDKWGDEVFKWMDGLALEGLLKFVQYHVPSGPGINSFASHVRWVHAHPPPGLGNLSGAW